LITILNKKKKDIIEVKNELVGVSDFVRQGNTTKTIINSLQMRNASNLENLLEKTSDSFNQKEKISGKGTFFSNKTLFINFCIKIN
jgi:hypothetical protein